MRTRFAGWMVLALLLHVLLVLIPIQRGSSPSERWPTLSIKLQQALRPDPAASAAPSPTEPRQPAVRESPDILPTPPPAEAKPPEPPALAPENTERPTVSAAVLLDSAKQLQWPSADAHRPRQLGEIALPSLPEKWRSGFPATADRFDGRALSEQVEIVDRWLAADGSHHVLVQTPTGEMMCGRAEAWDPRQPLIDPVMMFRSCGAGPSTFEWPEHYRRRSGLPPFGAVNRQPVRPDSR